MTDDTPTGPGPHDPHVAADRGPDAADDGRADDPLLVRAERVAELPLDERPAAFDGLNRAVVDELQALEEG